jgi:hypothetical protein
LLENLNSSFYSKDDLNLSSSRSQDDNPFFTSSQEIIEDKKENKKNNLRNAHSDRLISASRFHQKNRFFILFYLVMI